MRDGGVATLWTVGALAVVFAAVLAGVWLAAATVTRHRAVSAADLAALSVAAGVYAGAPDPCSRAEWVARGMRATLGRCTVRGWDAFIEVTVRPSGPLGRLGAASAHARAGPAAPRAP